jgi:Tfp pilus assembly protein PilO
MKFLKQISALKKYGLITGGMWAGWLIITAAIYVLVLGPQNTLMAKLNKDFAYSNEKYTLAQMAGRRDTKVRLNETLKAIHQKTARFIIPTEDATDLMFHISQLASQYQLQNFSAKDRPLSSFAENDEQSKIAESWQELSFSGDFVQIASFLNNLERNQPVIFVEDIDIRRDTQKTSLMQAKVLISYLVEVSENKKPKP